MKVKNKFDKIVIGFSIGVGALILLWFSAYFIEVSIIKKESDQEFFLSRWDLILPENLKRTYYYQDDETRYYVFTYKGKLEFDNEFSDFKNTDFEEEVNTAVETLPIDLNYKVNWTQEYHSFKMTRPPLRRLFVVKQGEYLFLIEKF